MAILRSDTMLPFGRSGAPVGELCTHVELHRAKVECRGKCMLCGYTLIEGDVAHLGEGLDGRATYCCERCSGLLKEIRWKETMLPRSFEQPEDATKLWRYMDFTKYVSLLATKSLYFCRADRFEDSYEGAKGLKSRKPQWDDHYLDYFRNAIRNPPPGYLKVHSDEEVEAQARDLLQTIEAVGIKNRESFFVSCWHANEYESEAMWRLYSTFLPSAVAVRTTYRRLYEALDRDPFVAIGHVQYLDFKSSYAGINDAFWRKRKSFQHEQEVRAIIVDRYCKDDQVGKLVPCNLAALIEEVFVSPNAPGWFASLVNDVNAKYGSSVQVSPSEMKDEPFF